MYIQESGHAGRDGETSCALLVYGRNNVRKGHTTTVKMRTSVAKRFCLKTLMAVILFQVVVRVVMYVEHRVRVVCDEKLNMFYFDVGV